MIIVMIG